MFNDFTFRSVARDGVAHEERGHDRQHVARYLKASRNCGHLVRRVGIGMFRVATAEGLPVVLHIRPTRH